MTPAAAASLIWERLPALRAQPSGDYVDIRTMGT
jgi:hypothetical protein